MGDIAKSKRPKVLRRKDGDKFSVYAKGGAVRRAPVKPQTREGRQ